MDPDPDSINPDPKHCLLKPLFSFLGSCSDASRLEDYSDSELEADCGPPPSTSPAPSLFLLELVLGCADQAVDTAAAHQPSQSFRIKIPKQSQLTEVTLLLPVLFSLFITFLRRFPIRNNCSRQCCGYGSGMDMVSEGYRNPYVDSQSGF